VTRRSWERATHRGTSGASGEGTRGHNSAQWLHKGSVNRGALAVRFFMRHGAIGAARQGGGDSGCVAADGVLPDSGGAAADRADARRVAAGADVVDRGAAGGGGEDAGG